MIAADTTMYRSKRQGRDRVVGSWAANGGGLGAMATASDAGFPSEAGAGPTTPAMGVPTPVGAASHGTGPAGGEGRPDSV
jgi:hypothetical protein